MFGGFSSLGSGFPLLLGGMFFMHVVFLHALASTRHLQVLAPYLPPPLGRRVPGQSPAVH
jgi:hypothetical protein